MPDSFERDGESKLERRVEPGRRGRPPVDSDSAQVVERVPAAATAKKADDPVQTASAAGNFNCRSRNEAEGTEAGDEGNVHCSDVRSYGMSMNALRRSQRRGRRRRAISVAT